jgi:hypothetical protein
VAGAVVFCAFGAASIAAADKSVMVISFFILVSPHAWRIVLFARSQFHFAWNCTAALSRESANFG